jgi:hypothetical protein
MIKNSFCLLNGLGEKTEKRLWETGILTWDDFLERSTVPFFGRDRKALYDEELRTFYKGLRDRNEGVFLRDVRKDEHWRFFEEFKNDAVCLDIETNGLMHGSGGYVTMVGLYDGSHYKCLIKGGAATSSECDNLTQESLLKNLSGYKYLITFYGSVFDIPFLKKNFPGLDFNMLHYDICLASRKVGIRGGLKKIEKAFGISRADEVDGLTGFDAVRLWNNHLNGRHDSLDTLIKYNREDTVNLMALGEIVFDELKRATGIESYLRSGGRN